MRKLKITWDEIVTLICQHYKIKDIKFYKHQTYEGDIEVYEIPEYAEGEIND